MGSSSRSPNGSPPTLRIESMDSPMTHAASAARLRPRRLRRTPGMRTLVRETALSSEQLVHPIFLTTGQRVERAIASMPGHAQRSVDLLGAEVDELAALRLPAVLLFGIPASKDATGSEAWSAQGPVARGIGALRRLAPDVVVIADVCLCEYTDHGHC